MRPEMTPTRHKNDMADDVLDLIDAREEAERDFRKGRNQMHAFLFGLGVLCGIWGASDYVESGKFNPITLKFALSAGLMCGVLAQRGMDSYQRKRGRAFPGDAAQKLDEEFYEMTERISGKPACKYYDTPARMADYRKLRAEMRMPV